METLIIVLLVALIIGGASTIGTLALLVLGCIYLNTQPKKYDEEERQLYTIPLSGGRTITQAEIDKAREAIMNYYKGGAAGGAAGGEAGGCGDANCKGCGKKEATPGGTYL